MNDFIARRMSQVFSDFRQAIRSRGKLCELKGLTWEGRNVPDYGNPFLQQHYLLRYYPAYLFEYFCLYDDILERGVIDAPLNVLSIGCGCGVDCDGLRQALVRHKRYAKGWRYTGVDQVEWGYREATKNGAVSYVTADIAAWKRLDQDDYNLIIFPKSLNDFSAEVFEHVKKMLAKSEFARDQVCLASSLMMEGMKSDIERFAELTDVMVKSHGFASDGDATDFVALGDHPIRKYVQSEYDPLDWVYPNDVQPFVKKLTDQCPTAKRNKKPCRQDCLGLSRNPITMTGNVAFKVVGLSRETD